MKGYQTFTHFFSSLWLAVLLANISQPALATTPQEQQLAEAVSAQIEQGKPVWLTAASGTFLAVLDQELSIAEKGAAILLPTVNEQVDANGLIHHLRTTLPQYGWTTLAVQLPLLDENSNSIYDYIENESEINNRLNAAINYLISNGSSNIIIIGKGIGAAAGANFLANKDSGNIRAYIGISMTSHTEQNSWLNSPLSLSKLTLPILDLYGSQDHLDVISSARNRMEASKKANQESIKKKLAQRSSQSDGATVVQERQVGRTVYTQLSVVGANNDFSGVTTRVSKKILGWLKNYAGGINLGI